MAKRSEGSASMPTRPATNGQGRTTMNATACFTVWLDGDDYHITAYQVPDAKLPPPPELVVGQPFFVAFPKLTKPLSKVLQHVRQRGAALNVPLETRMGDFPCLCAPTAPGLGLSSIICALPLALFAAHYSGQLEESPLTSVDDESDANDALATFPFHVLVVDHNGRVVVANGLLRKLMGVAPQEMLPLRTTHIHPFWRKAENADHYRWCDLPIARALQSEHPIEEFLIWEARDPEDHSAFLTKAQPTYDAHGHVNGASWMLHPLSLSAFTEGMTLRRATEISTVVEGMADGIMICDAQGKLWQMNAAARTMLGWDRLPLDPLEISGQPQVLAYDAQFNDGTPLTEAEWPLQRALHGENVEVMELSLNRMDGKRINVGISATPLQDANDTITGAVAVIRDMTEHHRYERLRESFMSMASHELRTPLTSLVLEQHLIRTQLERIHAPQSLLDLNSDLLSQLRQLNRLVDNMLELTGLTGGQFELHRSRVDVAKIVRAVVTELLAQHRRTPRTIVLAKLDEPIWLNVDPQRFGQVIYNLLANAIKFSPAAKPIEIEAYHYMWEDMSWFGLDITDGGVGIPEEQQPSLFDRVVETEEISRSSGMGYSLYLARAIMRKHGGTITVNSVFSIGSTFSVRLPLSPPHVDEHA